MQTFRCDDQHFGHLPFLFLPFAIAVSPFRMPICHCMPSSAITSSMARPISFASARNGVIHNNLQTIA